MHDLQTMTAALSQAETDGYKQSFTCENGELMSVETKKRYAPSDVTIVEHQRFEGPSSEDDSSVLYRIECGDGVRGTIVDAFGTYSNFELSEFLRSAPSSDSRIL